MLTRPTLQLPYRLAIVTEPPNKTDLEAGYILAGKDGQMLFSIAGRAGIAQNACLVVSNDDPALIDELTAFKPNLVLLLGDASLKLAKHYISAPDTDATEDDALDDFDDLKVRKNKTPIDAYRGSLFMGFDNQWKCLATYAPSSIFRFYGEQIYPFSQDFKRARVEASTSTLTLPKRNLEISLTPVEILDRLQDITTNHRKVAADIEGYVDCMSCISFATSATEAFIVPTIESFWGPLYGEMWRRLATLLEDPLVPKIFQNGLYDMFVLQYSYSICVRGVIDDTMLKHWELFCELPKSLGFQCSLYTREPYYKSDRGSVDRDIFWTYCCRDSAVTFEINDILDKQLKPAARRHYNFNMGLLDPILYMEMKGLLFDSLECAKRREEIEHCVHRLQYVVSSSAGYDLDTVDWLPIVRDAFCYVRQADAIHTVDDILPNCKPSCIPDATTAVNLLRSPLTCAARGQLSMLTEHGLNVESSDQMQTYLYDELKLPPQYKKVHGVLTDTLTADALALLKVYGKTNNPQLRNILLLRSLLTRAQNLHINTDGDGRVRCGYNVVGTETGRLSCYKSPTGSGFNLQTVTKRDRSLFIPDTGYWLFQCDLSGADGWTVAAHCRALGDSTMFDDYLFGLKPAKIIALLYLHGSEVLTWSRERLKIESRAITSEGWLYFACKCVQHGSNYGMGASTVSDTILRQSYKLMGEPIFVDKTTCETLQSFYFLRYTTIKRWHGSTQSKLINSGSLTSANFHTRNFFGRRNDNATLKQALADEPQNNTTYATNLALHKLWTDVDNRLASPSIEDNQQTFTNRRSCSLRIQPLHQVHDALIGQFRKDDTAWAVPRIKQYFNSPLTIAGLTVTIPFEGAYGKSWYDLNEGTI